MLIDETDTPAVSSVLAEEAPTAGSSPGRHGTTPHGSIADRDEEETGDEAADREAHGRRGADQPHPEDVQVEAQVGGLGRRPDAGRSERDRGRDRQGEGMETPGEGDAAPDLPGPARATSDLGHREVGACSDAERLRYPSHPQT